MLIFKMLIAKSMCVIWCPTNFALYLGPGFNPALLAHRGQNHSGITPLWFAASAALNSKILCAIVILAKTPCGVFSTAKTISWRAMCQKVLGSVFAKLKIFNFVITVDSILVMNHFFAGEKPANFLFHYKPVLKHIASAISVWVFRRFNFYVAIASSEFLACCKVFSAFSFHIRAMTLDCQKTRFMSC